ncbi:hypothetical protein POM88_001699 [Heracleum sosnowskyi]|uniref:C2H2-type domain-containing protein n=1 Tax=Heracleum sosnowskyi TaxID=360622 RepID=A0AAD8N9V2_9APIA|nr:hypothetical protein POM88_001699 [Heracleum sosnowskyi]
MGLFGLFYVVLKCIKLLAWPSFALVYPLCASIQAIETNSIHDMRKMVTYWIIFSLLCLFEHTFRGFLQWLPVWIYAKIVVILWLVIPIFDGAGIAYDSLVRPCLYAQLLQVVLDLLNKNQDLSRNEESFLVVAQRYVDEHGTEALEKLISPKTTTKTNADAEVRKMTTLAPLKENVQREWACAVCQVSTTSETTLNSHLQGRKHRTKCEELKAGKQTTKKGVTIGEPNRARYCAICQVSTQSEALWNSHLQSQKHKSKCEEFNSRVQATKKINSLCTTTKSNLAKQDPHKASSRGGPINKFRSANQNLKETSSGGGPNNRFGCDICQVKIQSEASMKSHLQGKKHKSKREQLKSGETTEGDSDTAAQFKKRTLTSRVIELKDSNKPLLANVSVANQVDIMANVSVANQHQRVHLDERPLKCPWRDFKKTFKWATRGISDTQGSLKNQREGNICLTAIRVNLMDQKEESALTDMPLGTAIHNIEITRGKGGQLARATGAVAKLIAKEGK